jgi:DNA-binding response OmpR family regulator
MADILVIEPDRVLAETYYEALTSAGHSVVVTPSAQTAIMVADETNPDIIVLEIQLIEHSGIEFLYELRSYVDWQNIPVIIQTQVPPGEFAGNQRLLKKQLGIAVYLYKPQTSLRQLVDAVAEYAPARA